mgnify:FL=1
MDLLALSVSVTVKQELTISFRYRTGADQPQSQSQPKPRVGEESGLGGDVPLLPRALLTQLTVVKSVLVHQQPPVQELPVSAQWTSSCRQGGQEAEAGVCW